MLSSILEATTTTRHRQIPLDEHANERNADISDVDRQSTKSRGSQANRIAAILQYIHAEKEKRTARYLHHHQASPIRSKLFSRERLNVIESKSLPVVALSTSNSNLTSMSAAEPLDIPPTTEPSLEARHESFSTVHSILSVSSPLTIYTPFRNDLLRDCGESFGEDVTGSSASQERKASTKINSTPTMSSPYSIASLLSLWETLSLGIDGSSGHDATTKHSTPTQFREASTTYTPYFAAVSTSRDAVPSQKAGVSPGSCIESKSSVCTQDNLQSTAPMLYTTVLSAPKLDAVSADIDGPSSSYAVARYTAISQGDPLSATYLPWARTSSTPKESPPRQNDAHAVGSRITRRQIDVLSMATSSERATSQSLTHTSKPPSELTENTSKPFSRLCGQIIQSTCPEQIVPLAAAFAGKGALSKSQLLELHRVTKNALHHCQDVYSDMQILTIINQSSSQYKPESGSMPMTLIQLGLKYAIRACSFSETKRYLILFQQRGAPMSADLLCSLTYKLCFGHDVENIRERRWQRSKMLEVLTGFQSEAHLAPELKTHLGIYRDDLVGYSRTCSRTWLRARWAVSLAQCGASDLLREEWIRYRDQGSFRLVDGGSAGSGEHARLFVNSLARSGDFQKAWEILHESGLSFMNFHHSTRLRLLEGVEHSRFNGDELRRALLEKYDRDLGDIERYLAVRWESGAEDGEGQHVVTENMEQAFEALGADVWPFREERTSPFISDNPAVPNGQGLPDDDAMSDGPK